MNEKRFHWLKLRQLDKKLEAVRAMQQQAPVPRDGWIKTIRTAIGMPAAQLAARLGVRQSTVSRLEKSECEGTASLESLRKAAAAMDCEVYYVLLPRMPLERVVTDRAGEVAAEDIERVTRTMSLENQSADDDVTRQQLEERREDLLRGSWRNLWK